MADRSARPPIGGQKRGLSQTFEDGEGVKRQSKERHLGFDTYEIIQSRSNYSGGEDVLPRNCQYIDLDEEATPLLSGLQDTVPDASGAEDIHEPRLRCPDNHCNKYFPLDRIKDHLRRAHLKPYSCPLEGCTAREGGHYEYRAHKKGVERHMVTCKGTRKPGCEEPIVRPEMRPLLRELEQRKLSYERITETYMDYMNKNGGDGSSPIPLIPAPPQQDAMPYTAVDEWTQELLCETPEKFKIDRVNIIKDLVSKAEPVLRGLSEQGSTPETFIDALYGELKRLIHDPAILQDFKFSGLIKWRRDIEPWSPFNMIGQPAIDLPPASRTTRNPPAQSYHRTATANLRRNQHSNHGNSQNYAALEPYADQEEYRPAAATTIASGPTNPGLMSQSNHTYPDPSISTLETPVGGDSRHHWGPMGPSDQCDTQWGDYDVSAALSFQNDIYATFSADCNDGHVSVPKNQPTMINISKPDQPMIDIPVPPPPPIYNQINQVFTAEYSPIATTTATRGGRIGGSRTSGGHSIGGGAGQLNRTNSRKRHNNGGGGGGRQMTSNNHLNTSGNRNWNA